MKLVTEKAADVDATQTRILDAAERLFAEQGFDGTTLRQITETAEANLASVNYHFGTKEELFRAVFLRRIRPMNAERMKLFAEAEQLAGDHAIPARHLLEILFRPILALVDSAGAGVHPFVRVMARNFIDPKPFMQPVVQAELIPIMQRFAPLLIRGMPHLTPEALLWRIRFIMGSAIFTFGKMQLIEQRLNQLGTPVDGETMLNQLLTFAEAGLAAPLAT